MRHVIAVVALLGAGCSATQGDDTDVGSDSGRRCTTSADCDDSIACTVDTCGPLSTCQYTPVDGLCETGETCVPGTGCVTGACTVNEECDDGVACTVDTCAVGNVCDHTPVDGLCPTGQACDPVEGCIDAGECTTDPECDDGIGCTIDSCVVGNVCEHDGRDELCPAGERCNPASGCFRPVPCTTWEDCPVDNFCDGRPRCEPEFGCSPPEEPRNCDDSDPCTEDVCDRDAEACVWTPNCSLPECVETHLDACLWGGCFDLDTTISQRCGLGSVNYNINRVCFSVVGSGAARMLSMQTSNGGGARYYTLNQAPFPTEAAFDGTFIVSGGCEETYRLEGRFRDVAGGGTDADHFDAVWTATYTDHDGFSCSLGMCANQNIPVSGTRVP